MVPRSNLPADLRRIRLPGREPPFAPIHHPSYGSNLDRVTDDVARSSIADRAAHQRAETVNAGEGC